MSGSPNRWLRPVRRLWRRLANGVSSWVHDLPAGSAAYWEGRYAAGGDSGAGSAGRLAEHKAEVLNRFLAEHQVRSVIDLGCGDGRQAALLDAVDYLGFDVSPSAIERCLTLHADDPHKRFALLDDYAGETAELAISLDVLYHLVERPVYESYLGLLTGCATRFLAIYSSDVDRPRRADGAHIRHREFSAWIRRNAPQWQPMGHVPNPYPFTGDRKQESFADFYFFSRRGEVEGAPGV